MSVRQSFDKVTILEELCKATGKWGLYINIYLPQISLIHESWKACSFLSNENEVDCQIVGDQKGYFLFDCEADMDRHYDMCVGRDGPTELNQYKGEVCVYALTCSPTEGFINENN